MNILKPPTEYAAELYALGLKATSREDSIEIVRKFSAAPADYILEVLNELEELEFAKEEAYSEKWLLERLEWVERNPRAGC